MAQYIKTSFGCRYFVLSLVSFASSGSEMQKVLFSWARQHQILDDGLRRNLEIVLVGAGSGDWPVADSEGKW